MYFYEPQLAEPASGVGNIIPDVTGQVSSIVEQGVRLGVERTWPMVEAKVDQLVQKYERKYMVAGLLIGGLAVLSMVLTINHEWGNR